jgi:hypothetical protein
VDANWLSLNGRVLKRPVVREIARSASLCDDIANSGDDIGLSLEGEVDDIVPVPVLWNRRLPARAITASHGVKRESNVTIL